MRDVCDVIDYMKLETLALDRHGQFRRNGAMERRRAHQECRTCVQLCVLGYIEAETCFSLLEVSRTRVLDHAQGYDTLSRKPYSFWLGNKRTLRWKSEFTATRGNAPCFVHLDLGVLLCQGCRGRSIYHSSVR